MPVKSGKIFSVFICLCAHTIGFGQSNPGRLAAVGQRIVTHAANDVGYQELTWRNDSPAYDFYRILGGNNNKKSKKGWQDATCGYGVYAWHRLAGVKPNVAVPGRAISWSAHPTRISLGAFAKSDDIAKLKPGWVIGFRFSGNNHVGVIEIPYALYAQTIEANTSTTNSVGSYKNNHEGVIRKLRFYKSASWATDWRNSPPSDTVSVLALRQKYLGK